MAHAGFPGRRVGRQDGTSRHTVAVGITFQGYKIADDRPVVSPKTNRIGRREIVSSSSYLHRGLSIVVASVRGGFERFLHLLDDLSLDQGFDLADVRKGHESVLDDLHRLGGAATGTVASAAVAAGLTVRGDVDFFLEDEV